jgi:glycosyltransferase involved in cell wall biosynthesis
MLSDFYFPIITGTQIQNLLLSKELIRRGHKVDVCTTGYGYLPEFNVERKVKVFRIRGLFQRIPLLFKDPKMRYHPPVKDPIITKKLKKIIEMEKPDIIHAHGWIMYSALPLIGKYSIPLIATLHDNGLICPKRSGEICKQPLTNTCLSCGKETYGTLKSFLVYFALKMNKPKLKQVDRFLAISLYQKSIYSKNLGLNNNDIILIPNAVDLEEFFPGACTKESMRRCERKLGVKSNSNKIVHIGRFSRDKLHAILNVVNATPRIVKEFPNTQILLVGDGPFFDYVSKLAEKINHQLGRVSVIMTGSMKEEDMPEIIDLADIVIGVGRVPLEAMACGKPVIVAGGIVGPLGGNYGGIVTPKNIAKLKVHNFSGRNSLERTNPRNIAEACTRLLVDKEYRSFLGRFGREYVEKEHDVRKIVRQVEAVYHDALKAKKHFQRLTG